jgi:hypothetical protein
MRMERLYGLCLRLTYRNGGVVSKLPLKVRTKKVKKAKEAWQLSLGSRRRKK